MTALIVTCSDGKSIITSEDLWFSLIPKVSEAFNDRYMFLTCCKLSNYDKVAIQVQWDKDVSLRLLLWIDKWVIVTDTIRKGYDKTCKSLKDCLAYSIQLTI